MHIILICSPRSMRIFDKRKWYNWGTKKLTIIIHQNSLVVIYFYSFSPVVGQGPFYYYIERTLPFFQHSERTTKHFSLFVACTKDLYNNAGHGDFSVPKIPSLYPRYGYIHPHTHIIYIYGYNTLRSRAAKIN